MNLRDHWLHESGGLVWHARALRWRNSLWQPFRHSVADWLRHWTPPCDRLLIIGPSAGYTLPPDWLRTWQEVTACEPDPLARLLLPRRMARSIRFQPLDVFAPGGLASLATKFPQHAILFSNVLGQCMPRHTSGLAWQRTLRSTLHQQHWASYHDVISTRRAPDTRSPQTAPGAGTLEAAIAGFWQGGELEITDHGSFGLGEAEKSPLEERAFAVWSLRPDQHHLIEWIRHAPG